MAYVCRVPWVFSLSPIREIEEWAVSAAKWEHAAVSHLFCEVVQPSCPWQTGLDTMNSLFTLVLQTSPKQWIQKWNCQCLGDELCDTHVWFCAVQWCLGMVGERKQDIDKVFPKCMEHGIHQFYDPTSSIFFLLSIYLKHSLLVADAVRIWALIGWVQSMGQRTDQRQTVLGRNCGF